MKKTIIAIIILVLLVATACQTTTQKQDLPEQKIDSSPKEEVPEPAPSEELQKPEDTEAMPAEAPAEPKPVPAQEPEEEYQIIEPDLIYPGAYNGPLFDTSLQIGSRGDMGKHFENFDRNGVNFFIGFFKIDSPPEAGYLIDGEGLGFMLAAIEEHPYRVIPYTSLSYDAEDVPEILGEKMTGYYRENLAAIKAVAGDDLIRGFGELEIMDYSGYRVNSPELVQIYDLADENGIWIMFHPKSGQTSQVKEILEKYPDITFLIHLFREDLSKDIDKYIDLMKTHDNLVFSIDIAHILHYKGNDILYSYYDDFGDSAGKWFIDAVTKSYNSLLSSAVSAYKPMVEAVPGKVMWGTEAGPAYAFEPEVYDLMIKASRDFIAKVTSDTSVQEDLAYKNALRVFGKGIKLDKEIEIKDSSGWPKCTNSQTTKCEEAADKCGDIDTPENEKCLTKCFIEAECFDPEVDD